MRESGPYCAKTSVSAASAPLPENGRTRISGTSAGSTPRKRNAGERTEASSSDAPLSRNSAIAAEKTASVGRIVFKSGIARAAPSRNASNTLTRRTAAYSSSARIRIAMNMDV